MHPKQTVRRQSARAHRDEEVRCHEGPDSVRPRGTWQQAAQIITNAEGHASLDAMPPSFAALNDPKCLEYIGQMYFFVGGGAMEHLRGVLESMVQSGSQISLHQDVLGIRCAQPLVQSLC